MTDIYVHVHMKECCRAVLTSMDAKKEGHEPTGGLLSRTLAPWLGRMPIPAAEVAIGTATSSAHDDLLALGRAAGAVAGKDWKGAVVEAVSVPIREMTDLLAVVRLTCRKMASVHAAEHETKGETQEAAFWKKMEHTI